MFAIHNNSNNESPGAHARSLRASTHGAQAALSQSLCSASRGWKLPIYCASTSGASSTLSVYKNMSGERADGQRHSGGCRLLYSSRIFRGKIGFLLKKITSFPK